MLFKELADQVQAEWATANFDLEVFPSIALKALETFKYDSSASEFNSHVTGWLLGQQVLPTQINVHNTFGQPPITLFNNGKFVVDVYIWQNFDTSLHSHGFRGAFRVLFGKSLHEEFAFKPVEKFAPDVFRTSMVSPTRSLLFAGDSLPILAGDRLTHRVIHLE
ncbi:MAG: hypothetical protein EOP06_15505, partial [Proteobacteria bacterium]